MVESLHQPAAQGYSPTSWRPMAASTASGCPSLRHLIVAPAGRHVLETVLVNSMSQETASRTLGKWCLWAHSQALDGSAGDRRRASWGLGRGLESICRALRCASSCAVHRRAAGDSGARDPQAAGVDGRACASRRLRVRPCSCSPNRSRGPLRTKGDWVEEVGALLEGRNAHCECIRWYATA